MSAVIHELGYVVMSKDGAKQLSARYSIRSAADEALALWRKAGHPEAFIRTVRGLEGPRGSKRAFNRFHDGSPSVA